MKYSNLLYALALNLPIAASTTADGLRDPTRPPAPARPSVIHREPPPTLSAVRIAGAQRIAVFNGTVVREGDSVDGYRILAVLADGVRFSHAGRTQELYLTSNDASFKKPSSAPARTTAGVQ